MIGLPRRALTWRYSQSWRVISPRFLDDAIYYATDAEFDQNHIFRTDRATGERSVVTGTDGPCYYSARIGSSVLFATTAELCPSQKGDRAAIWSVDADGRAESLGSWRKDLFRSRRLGDIFQCGIVQFPSSDFVASALPFTGTGLQGLNDRMFIIRSILE